MTYAIIYKTRNDDKTLRISADRVLTLENEVQFFQDNEHVATFYVFDLVGFYKYDSQV